MTEATDFFALLDSTHFTQSAVAERACLGSNTLVRLRAGAPGYRSTIKRAHEALLEMMQETVDLYTKILAAAKTGEPNGEKSE